MASIQASAFSKDYVSYCNCARMGRSKECCCAEEQEEFDWFWDPFSTQSDSIIQENGREVIFHSNYSSGTAAIRGTIPFCEGHHFWEIKMTTPVYGTDMMIGVATEDMELDKFINSFCSLLGRDGKSWGLSYLGTIHHQGKSRPFTNIIGQGAIVGLHLDMWHGTLSFYLNRQPLGVAYHGLQGRKIYPVVSSTAARSGMKLISTKWFPASLQFMCCQALRRCIQQDRCVLDSVILPPGLNTFLENNLSWLLRSHLEPSPCLSMSGTQSLINKKSHSARIDYDRWYSELQKIRSLRLEVPHQAEQVIDSQHSSLRHSRLEQQGIANRGSDLLDAVHSSVGLGWNHSTDIPQAAKNCEPARFSGTSTGTTSASHLFPGENVDCCVGRVAGNASETSAPNPAVRFTRLQASRNAARWRINGDDDSMFTTTPIETNHVNQGGKIKPDHTTGGCAKGTKRKQSVKLRGKKITRSLSSELTSKITNCKVKEDSLITENSDDDLKHTNVKNPAKKRRLE